MKHLLITTIAAVVLVGCGESQQSAPAPESKPVEPVAEAAKPESKPVPPTAKSPWIGIYDAAYQGNIEAIKKYIADGTDVNVEDIGFAHITPLHIAASEGHKEVVELLITKGADLNAVSTWPGYQGTPLDLASRDNQTETADLLRKHGGKSAEEDSIHVAAKRGNIKAVKQHLAEGVDVNTNAVIGEWTPLHYAAYGGHKDVAEMLIGKGADVNMKRKGGWVPLHDAAWTGQEQLVELLIAKGANVNTENSGGETPLDWAKDKSETAEILRKHGGKTGEELKAEGQ